MKSLICTFFIVSTSLLIGQTSIQDDINQIEGEVIKWRRHFHQYPELSNREFKTAEKIAKHLNELGLEVQTQIAHTGVVALLKGDKPGKVLALRADIDALPVTERVNIPFKSEVKTVFEGVETGVMHACGHDTHIAILMGVAEILSKHKNKIHGTVKFIFQPAEEGAPKGEEGGAELMVKEGVLQNPKVDAIFGLHINSGLDVGKILYKTGGIMAASQTFRIKVSGKQSHGSRPWSGIDPIVASAKIIDGLQTIISREANLTQEAAVITVGKITGGVRSNIIPESAEMVGTLRTLDYEMQKFINKRMKELVPAIAASYRAKAEIEIEKGYPITYNDPELTQQMLPSLKAVAGNENVIETKAITGAEDFSFFQQKIPGMYFFLGGKSVDAPMSKVYPHHTPDFYLDESGMKLGVEAFVKLTLDFLKS